MKKFKRVMYGVAINAVILLYRLTLRIVPNHKKLELASSMQALIGQYVDSKDPLIVMAIVRICSINVNTIGRVITHGNINQK